ncbi:MAG: HK97 gp10 family phage protein [Acutalibacter sp.]
MNLKQRAAQLRKIEQRFPGKLEEVCVRATVRAVEAAQEKTPPTGGDLKGANTRTGAMKQSWATASQYSPKRQGDDYTTVLGNDMEYASYVNDGHRMDRHFVPGLVVNPYSGLLEYNPDGKGGIVVGIKTAYVPGVHMVDDAKGTYSQVLKKELKDIGEVFE